MRPVIGLLLCLPLVLGIGCRGRAAPKAEPKAATPQAKARKPLPESAPLPIAPVQGGRFRKDDPRWERASAARLSAAEYGEPNWDHARLAALTHLALSGRDLARLSAARGAYKECGERYLLGADLVAGVPLHEPAVTPVRDVLVAGLRRDGAVCLSLAAGGPPEARTGFSGFRSRYFALAQRAERGEDVREAARTLAAELNADASLDEPAPLPSASPAAQSLWLARRWDDTVDPLVVSEPWGSWTTAERPRQIAGLRAALGAIATGESTGLYLRPAAALQPVASDWSITEFTTTPLGDSWGDVGGFAMPHVLPQLDETAGERSARIAAFEPMLARWPTMREGELPRAVAAAVARYDDLPEGIRHFARLSIENGAIRQLARQGHYLLAAEIVGSQWHSRGLDCFAADRRGVLLGLEGRLRLLAADKGAEAKLQAALAESQLFLAWVAEREAAEAEAAGVR